MKNLYVRFVPLTLSILVCASVSFGADEIHVYAGKSWSALYAQNAGSEYMAKGDFANARKKFDEAIRLDPTMWPAYLNRASLDVREHKLNAALQDATMALRGKTSFNRSAVLRAEINMKLGNYASAMHELDERIKLGRRGDAYEVALNDSAWVRATCPSSGFRNGQLAVEQATHALSLASAHKSLYADTLAATYAEVGDFDAAIRTEQQALSLAKSPEDMKDLQQHMAAFKRHHPWRDVSK